MVVLSTEKIEIDGKEYTLFLNRKGLLSWENITKVSKKANDLQDKYKDTIKQLNNKNDNEEIEVTDETNPFDYSGEDNIDDLDNDAELLLDVYMKFYWIALYENHKLPISSVKELFDKAIEEYGIEQLIQLANQMIEDINKNKYGNKETKKLTALHQTK